MLSEDSNGLHINGSRGSRRSANQRNDREADVVLLPRGAGNGGYTKSEEHKNPRRRPRSECEIQQGAPTSARVSGHVARALHLHDVNVRGHVHTEMRIRHRGGTFGAREKTDSCGESSAFTRSRRHESTSRGPTFTTRRAVQSRGAQTRARGARQAE
ncbi:hypothetical protein AKJ09_01007 [Labilithrix luteola]|uniref:Uncharacterized protein n=1 Tax=Labilithrix luteola TaxID=1391654 RepID=A0A0K1PLD5_9BACT|nr:hypothetical protein AKJ09_01007 [Labilithrix luteola]